MAKFPHSTESCEQFRLTNKTESTQKQYKKETGYTYIYQLAIQLARNVYLAGLWGDRCVE